MEKTDGQKKKLTTPAIISIVICVILVPVLLFNFVLVIKGFMDDEHVPELFGISPVVVLSGSMEPTISTGSIIVIKNVDASQLEVGDVICYIQDGTAITHRIVQISTSAEQLGFITQGDANNSVDRLTVYESQIEGRYMWQIPYVGNIAIFAQTTAGMLLFIAVPIMLWLAVDLLGKSKENKASKEKQRELEEKLARLEENNQNPPTE